MQNTRTLLSLYYENLLNNLDVPALITDNETITYSVLENRSNQIAESILSHGLPIESPVGIYLPRDINYIVSLLAVLKSGCCFVPLDTRYPKQRLKKMISNTKMQLIISNSELFDDIMLSNRATILIDNLNDITLKEISFPEIKPENLAYIIYTSGSTGQPKGIEIEHRNAVNMLMNYNNNFFTAPGMPVTQTASIGFDASLWEIFPALIYKHCLHIINNDLLIDMPKLINFLKDKKIINCFLSTPIAEMFLESDWQQLSDLKYLTVGGDRLQKRPPEKFPAKLINVYGPAECCIMVSQKEVEISNPEHKLPSIGKPINNNEFHILDEEGKPVSIGETGEIYISGANVGRGYHNLLALTKKSFFSGKELNIEAERVYRTGDLGYQYSDGDFVCIGRTDFQVKIRGQRIELAEIENALIQINEIRENTVRVWENSQGEKHIIAWIILRHPLTEKEILSFLEKNLPDYMIPEFFFFMDSYPLTENGKIDYNKLPSPERNLENKEIILPKNETEEKILEIWKEILKLEFISTNDDFFSLGGHSLTAAQMMVRIRSKFNVELTANEIREHSTLKSLSKFISGKKCNLHQKALTKQPKQKSYPLSREQQELWVIHHLDKTALTHNIMLRLDLWGNLNEKIFTKAVKNIINKHIMLHCSFTEESGIPKFFEDLNPSYQLPVITSDKESGVKNLIEELAATEFDLSKPPLFKHKLLKLTDTHYLYLMCIHHLITDGWSMGLFIKELGDEYKKIQKNDESSQTNDLDYQDYVLWQKELQPNSDLKWWLYELKPKPQPLFPVNSKPRNKLKYFNGKRLWFWIDSPLTAKLKKFAAKHKVTLFSLMLAMFKLTILKETGRHDLVVGTPYANRSEIELENIFGYFTNMISLYSQYDLNKTLSEIVHYEHQICQSAFDHANTPFGHVVEKLGYKYKENLHPLFQILFIFQNYPFPKELFPEIKFDFTELGNKTTNIDFTCNVTEKAGQLECWFMYQTELYEEKDISRLQKTYLKLLEYLPENHETPLNKLIDFKEHPDNNCWLFGRTGLLLICAEMLLENGFYIQGIISDDMNIRRWCDNKDIPCYSEDTHLLTLLSETPFDYLLSIINEVIIPDTIYRLAKKAAVNFHDSLLPQYAGMYATTWAIVNNEADHGISWHLIRNKIDAGDIIVQQKFKVAHSDTAASLNARCFSKGISGFRILLHMFKNNKIDISKQELEKRTYYGLYKRPDLVLSLDFTKSANDLEREIRALDFAEQDNELGFAKIFHNSKYYIVKQASIVNEKTSKNPGTILSADKYLLVQTAENALKFTKIYDADAVEIEINKHFQKNDIINGLNKDDLKTVRIIYKKSQKNESFWINKWEHYTHLITGSSNSNDYNKYIKVPLRDNQNPALFTIFLSLYFDQPKFSCLLWKKQSNVKFGLVHEYLPLNIDIDFGNSLDFCFNHIKKDMLTLKSSTPYLRDIFYRYKRLYRDFFNDSIIISNNDYKVNGKELIVIEAEDYMKCLKFNAQKFDAASVQQLIKHWYIFRNRFLENNEIALNDLELASEKDIDFQLHSLNDTFRDYPLKFNYPSLFDQKAQHYSQNIAIENNNEKITYRDFSEKSSIFAAYLMSESKNSNIVAAVCMPGCINLAITAMAVLKAGYIYMPLNPDYPKNRLQYIVNDSAASIAIVNNDTKSAFDDLNIITINIDDYKFIGSQIREYNFKNDLPAYLIYTSGSTGNPKGVLVSHRSLVNHCCGAIDIYQLQMSDRMLQFSSLSFDISIEEMFPTWLSGGTLVFRNEEAKLSVKGFLNFIQEKNISIVDLPTAFWHQLTQELSSNMIPQSLKAVIVGGEKVKHQFYKKWLEITDHEIRFYNTYGPTETTVIASYCLGKPDSNQKSFPIGKPVPNCQLFILDSRKKIRPAGLNGELYIGGEGVAIGYHNKNEQTNSVFLKIEYSKNKVYCSGDIVCLNPDGEIGFIGRKDKQLKISGFRIEPDEIVNVLESFHAITQAHVDVYKKNDHGFLTAWIQSAKIELDELQSFLEKSLPKYMIPAKFVILNQLPVTVNGKINTKALPAPPDFDADRVFVEPYNEFQRLLCRLFQEILNIKKVGLKDNFFKLGGNSLLAMKLITKIQHSGMELSINDLFNHADIEELSKSLSYRSSEEKGIEDFSLVKIQSSSKNFLPLVICHLSPGDLLGYSALFQELPDNIPIYGLQSPSLFNDEYTFDSISELAAWYIDLLDRHFGNTDYILFGHCFGGTLAYEIACQLELQHRAPAKIILSETWLFPPASGWQKWHYRIHKIKNIFSMNPLDFLYYLRVKFLNHDPITPFVEIKEEAVNNPLFLKRVELQNKHLHQVLKYQYRTIKQHINLFIAKNYPKGLIPDPTLGWNAITKRYSIYRFDAMHNNIIWKPAVKEMAAVLKDMCKRK